MDPLDELIARTEQRRIQVSEALRPSSRAQLGQFFTPAAAATLIAEMPRLPSHGVLRILDPGAGVGSLTTALVARILREAPQLDIQVMAVEIDPDVAAGLQMTLDDCVQAATSTGTSISATVLTEDLIDQVTGFERATGPLSVPFDLVIMNPPYRKLAADSRERHALAAEGIDCPNLYCTLRLIHGHDHQASCATWPLVRA
ncbi:MAG TPA: N-6 DNA methylase [Streptosporangiaceae bacterium]|nr:N-6 DNA methylase [Streptosporangiaceae bacterium]